jgi:hypothetical protein
LALSHPPKESHEIALASVVLFASLAVLAPHASAQQCGYEPADLSFDSLNHGSLNHGSLNHDSLNHGAPYPGTYCNQDPLDRGAVECGRDNIGAVIADGSVGGQASPATREPAEAARTQSSNAAANAKERSGRRKLPDRNRDIYYRNKLEFSFDAGWLPRNIPFPFDLFEGDPYDLYPLRYTLVPIIGSLRWQIDDVGSPWIFRGNWDVTFSGSVTAIPRGPETRYLSYDMGLRRNLVHPNWRVVPYVDIRAGLGLIDAKGPLGVYYAQGQNFTFTMNMGAGARYDFNPRYAISAGLNWMHISNNNLSAPQYSNYGINVYGPMFGIDIALRRHSRHSE